MIKQNSQSKLKQLETKWDNLDRWVKRVLGAIATVGTIIGLATGVATWTTSQIDHHLDAKIETITAKIAELDTKSDTADSKLELSNTRLELTTLIAHNPENVIEIERVARYYFMDLGGDWYMSKIYSDWAREHGGDLSFVVHKE